MPQFLITLLLATSILACPLRCSLPVQTGFESESFGCKCCCSGNLKLGKETDSKPSPTSNETGACPDCICHGALSEDTNDFDSPYQYFGVASLTGADTLRVLLDAAIYQSIVKAALDDSLRPFGRAARIAHQSLLI